MNKFDKKGVRLWNKAKKIIPGGNSILSKRPERYLPDFWPTYFKKSQGIKIWDLNNKQYLDFAQMGIGSSILGYSNKKINDAVRNEIKKGINTTLNTKHEYDLAKILLKCNPGFSGVKFARSGGEAMSIAVRIARATTNSSKILFSGYHGWFDWYLATNLQNQKNLSNHLLPGLSTRGIPSELKNTIHPFLYDDASDFLRVWKKNKDVKIIVIESGRYNFPQKNFVKAIMKIVKERNIVLICDEITTGFRYNGTGLYKSIGLDPNLVVFGKGMGNGFAISAIVGKKREMENAKGTFISSTNWSESVGFVAAKKTIQEIKKKKIWKSINQTGKMIAQGWKYIFKKYNLDIKVSNFYPLITMFPNYGKLNNFILTYFIQEMLKKNFLVASSVYVSFAHKKKDVTKYLKACDSVFSRLDGNINKKFFDKNLLSKQRSDAFKRL